MFNKNHNIILHYSNFVRSQVIFFHSIYFGELFIEFRLDTYKLGIIFAMY